MRNRGVHIATRDMAGGYRTLLWEIARMSHRSSDRGDIGTVGIGETGRLHEDRLIVFAFMCKEINQQQL